MKYEYNRPSVKINNWLVSKEDIKRVYDFICERLYLKKMEINLETESGNNRTYEDYSELEKDLPRLEVNKETVSKIMMVERITNKNNYLEFKQLWMDLGFGAYPEATFHVIAGDRNGKYKDWIAGTYEQMEKLKELFEVHDEKIISMLKKEYKPIIFDPDKKIASVIKEKINSKEGKPTIINKKWWERTWVQLIFLLGAIAGIIGLLFVFRK